MKDTILQSPTGEVQVSNPRTDTANGLENSSHSGQGEQITTSGNCLSATHLGRK